MYFLVNYASVCIFKKTYTAGRFHWEPTLCKPFTNEFFPNLFEFAWMPASALLG